ncbi:MAG: LacI family transcriptional regulator [Acidobacteria bacterium]|nr:LacI family transcriptional regulator [Acidobacteriota bacterium]
MVKKSGPLRTAKIDIRDVASRAGVSIATVSRVMNHVPTVDAVLSARVWEAVEELDYLPNTQARALVSGKSRLLGLIVSEITNPFFPELIQEFERAAVKWGYEILLGSTNYEAKTMELCARRMLERKVDGVAIMTFGIDDFLLDRFEADNVPVVFIDPAPARPLSSFLAVDYYAGIHEGVEHLVGLGHKSIGFISGPRRLRSAATRKATFLESLRVAGLKAEPAFIVEGNHTLDGGRDAMQKLLALRKQPTAIMCSNDMTAIGVQHALFEANLKVPDDFSLIGFDDIHLAEYTIPPLTTVRMSCEDIAQKAVENLLSRLRGDAGGVAAASLVMTRLIVRQTTGKPKRAVRGAAASSTKSKKR